MPRAKPSDQVKNLKQKQKELMDKLKEAQRRERAERLALQDRKERIVGELILKAISKLPDGQIALVVRELLDATLRNTSDRALFGLPPRDDETGGGSVPMPPGDHPAPDDQKSPHGPN